MGKGKPTRYNPKELGNLLLERTTIMNELDSEDKVNVILALCVSVVLIVCIICLTIGAVAESNAKYRATQELKKE
jgi:hypothetical protein